MRGNKFKDITGKRFGRLQIVKPIESRNGQWFWECKCDCGNIKTLGSIQLSAGRTNSCGCYRKEFRSLMEKEAAINKLYNSYKKTAQRKEYDFELDRFQFLALVIQRCHYCGIEPQNTTKPSHFVDKESNTWFIHNGVDRLDNTKGYIEANVVPCCTTCNYAKRTMSKEQFLSWVNRIYKYSVASISEKTPGMIIDELGTTLIKCFMAQEDILNPSKTTQQQKDAAERAQELNARRNKLIRALDSYFNLEDNSHTSKTYYSYFDPSNYERNESAEMIKKGTHE